MNTIISATRSAGKTEVSAAYLRSLHRVHAILLEPGDVVLEQTSDERPGRRITLASVQHQVLRFNGRPVSSRLLIGTDAATGLVVRTVCADYQVWTVLA